MRIYNESFTKQVLEGNSERSVKHRIADFLLRYRSTPHGLVQGKKMFDVGDVMKVKNTRAQ